MPSTLGIETAQRISAAWPTANSLKDAMGKAGVKNQDMRALNLYRRQTEELLNTVLLPHNPKHCSNQLPGISPEAGIFEQKKPYDVVIFSDAHWWPNQERTLSHRILLNVIEELRPRVVIDNGDSLDGARISRHPPNGWEEKPILADEVEQVQFYLDEIKSKIPRGCRLFRNIGNHDSRFEMIFAKKLPEFEGLKGTKISDLFPGWKHKYAVYLNNTLKIKHRWKGGIHSAYNNAVGAGISHATAHTHRLTIREVTNERGTHYGIETGTIADLHSMQFTYAEENTKNQQNGFIVVRIDGKRIYPEKVEVIDGKAWFRGKEWTAY